MNGLPAGVVAKRVAEGESPRSASNARTRRRPMSVPGDGRADRQT